VDKIFLLARWHAGIHFIGKPDMRGTQIFYYAKRVVRDDDAGGRVLLRVLHRHSVRRLAYFGLLIAHMLISFS
jgi:hypothetical protein